MKYLYTIIGTLFVVLIGTTLALIDLTGSQKAEITRLQTNQNALNDTVIHYLTKSGEHAIRAQELTYSLRELKKYEQELVATIKDLKLNPKQVDAIIKAEVKTSFKDTLPIKTIVVPGDTVRCFHKTSEDINMIGCIRGDSVDLEFMVYDHITGVVHWNYKKWWIFKIKDRNNVSLTLTNKNKYNEFTYNKYVRIKK